MRNDKRRRRAGPRTPHADVSKSTLLEASRELALHQKSRKAVEREHSLSVMQSNPKSFCFTARRLNFLWQLAVVPTLVSAFRPVSGRHSVALSGSATLESPTIAIPPHIREVWGIRPNLASFPGANFPLGGADSAPPILELPNFVSADECQAIQEWAKHSIANGAKECDDYLNYRVNKEVEQGGSSQEGKTLIDEFNLDETQLSASHRGGFRVRLDDYFVEGMLKTRLLGVLGMPNKRFVFEEGAWIRPSPRTVVVRDKTVVFYGPGNGVPPHVDGRDATLLVYLCDVPEGVGGRTVFPEDNFAQTPKQGTALLYRSKKELLHYSEAMISTDEKWIMQLLLDFNHDYQPGDTVTDFRTGESYVWDGRH